MLKEFFPDETMIDNWFYETPETELSKLGKHYVVTDYEIYDDGKVYTKEFQRLIDTVSKNGGGVIIVPKGTYMTGAIYLKSGVNLYIKEEGTLKGSDDISDYPVIIVPGYSATTLYIGDSFETGKQVWGLDFDYVLERVLARIVDLGIRLL